MVMGCRRWLMPSATAASTMARWVMSCCSSTMHGAIGGSGDADTCAISIVRTGAAAAEAAGGGFAELFDNSTFWRFV